MKITKVKWKGHEILGNLEIDFFNPASGSPYDNIFLVGENGTGKTSILESISSFLNGGSFIHFEYIDYEIAGRIYRCLQFEGSDGNTDRGYHQRVDPNETIEVIRTSRYENPAIFRSDPLDIRINGCVFSKARADYKTNGIGHPTHQTLDNEHYELDDNEDFTALKQLIVDVDNQDITEYAERNKALVNNALTWDQFLPDSKIYRFRQAFDTFFDNLKYDGVKTSGNQKIIQFKKYEKLILIDSLSTGEKQIVFRGIYLLRNSSNLAGGTVFIDEPELSMHPKWQQRVLRYYIDLFSYEGVQKVQLFFASHSEYVLKEALKEPSKNLIISLKNDNGTLAATRILSPHVLPSITAAETNYLIFDMVSNDYHIELYGWIQAKYSKLSVKSCDTFISQSPHFNTQEHSKQSGYLTTQYVTLSTYIRNAIDHPDPSRTYTEQELRTSIKLLIKICQQLHS